MSAAPIMKPTEAPPFVKLKDGCENNGDPNNWDGWCVTPSGDEKADYAKGAEYCDIALRKVIESESPGALTFTLTTIFQKIVGGQIAPSAMEKGFIDCLARRAADRRAQLDQN